MRALLTGGQGFVVARLAAELRARHPDRIIEAPDRAPTQDAPIILDVTDAAGVLRAAPIPRIVGDASRLRAATG